MKENDNKKIDNSTTQTEINNQFQQWKKTIDETFFKLTSFHLDDIPDLPYYDYFYQNVKKEIVIEIALNNIL